MMPNTAQPQRPMPPPLAVRPMPPKNRPKTPPTPNPIPSHLSRGYLRTRRASALPTRSNLQLPSASPDRSGRDWSSDLTNPGVLPSPLPDAGYARPRPIWRQESET